MTDKTTLLQRWVSSYSILLTPSDTYLCTLAHSYSPWLAAVSHLSLCNWTSFMPKVGVWWHLTYLWWSMTCMYKSPTSSDPVTLGTMLTVCYQLQDCQGDSKHKKKSSTFSPSDSVIMLLRHTPVQYCL